MAGGGSRITPINFSFYGVAVLHSLRIAGLKAFHEICCSWMLLRLMRTKTHRIVRKYVTPRMKTYMCIGACLERHMVNI
jgi:hypothetical protein